MAAQSGTRQNRQRCAKKSRKPSALTSSADAWTCLSIPLRYLYVGHDVFIYETRLLNLWDMTHSHVGHDSCELDRMGMSVHPCTVCIFGAWLNHIWDVTHSYVGHASFIHGTSLIQTWDMAHSSTAAWMCPSIPMEPPPPLSY